MRSYTSGKPDVHVHRGDCNIILPQLLQLARRAQYRRALCVLDPYNIDLAWDVVATAGRMGTIEIFVNFMVMDMNMNVLLNRPHDARPAQIERMNRFWGDESWKEAIYAKQQTILGDDELVKLADSNAKIAAAYRARLAAVAGFAFVAEPLPFLNDQGATIYYLFFASPNPTGHKIVVDIFKKYRKRQGLKSGQ